MEARDMATDDNDLVQVPADLTLLSDEELRMHEERTTQEIIRVSDPEADLTPESVEYALRLDQDRDRLLAEIETREIRARNEADAQRQRLGDQLASVRSHVTPAPEGDDDGSAPVGPDPRGGPSVDSIAAAAARGATAALVAVLGERGGLDLQSAARKAASLADTRRYAPKVVAPSATDMVVTASVDIPGVGAGTQLTFDQVVDAFQRRAKSLPVGDSGRSDAGPRVVTLRNQYTHTIDDRSSPAQVDELIKHLTSVDKQQALVAGGGWCAPSEIRYDFFNIACVDGLVDLPTFGVSRGGIRYPTSPSLADSLGGGTALYPFAQQTFSNTSTPWLWTETDDTLAATGSPTKPCIRVPCPTFNERRLECYGLCLTAGNLTDDAYPESTANFLRLLLASHQHAMNARILATMASLSTAAVTGGDFAEGGSTTFRPAFNQIVGGITLAAVDYRARYGMCSDDVLECVVPYWVKEVIRADLAWRTNVELLDVTDAQIQGFFTVRNVRPQWVNDWQIRTGAFPGTATALTAWPTSATIMMYAAGTFILGNGLTLDLGVVRDSVLNKTNDFTAAWSEECHLVALVGHESRQYTITWAVNGAPSLGTALASNL